MEGDTGHERDAVERELGTTDSVETDSFGRGTVGKNSLEKTVEWITVENDDPVQGARVKRSADILVETDDTLETDTPVVEMDIMVEKNMGKETLEKMTLLMEV